MRRHDSSDPFCIAAFCSSGEFLSSCLHLQDHLSTRVTLLEGRQAELAQQLEAAAAANEGLTAANIALKQAAQEQVHCGCIVIQSSCC
jgi:outer membrane murein-binding lipoprotein Lpp